MASEGHQAPARLGWSQRRRLHRFQSQRLRGKIRVFTTSIDTIYGATAVVFAAEHPILPQLLDDSALKDQVMQFAEQIKTARAIKTQDQTDEEEKLGMNTGRLAINPFNGEFLPIWVANYVLMDYGAGAVMSVPAHDERDFEFAQKYT